MNFVFKSIVYTLLLLIFSSCDNLCTKLYLSEEDKSWVAHFSEGMVSYYKDTNGNIDTLIVTRKHNYLSSCVYLELGKYQYENYFVVSMFKSKRIYDSSTVEILIARENIDSFANLTIQVGDVYSKSIINRSDWKPINTHLNNIAFDSVYYLNNVQHVEQYGENKLFKNFYWSRKLGLVAYTTSDNHLFVMSK